MFDASQFLSHMDACTLHAYLGQLSHLLITGSFPKSQGEHCYKFSVLNVLNFTHHLYSITDCSF